MAEALGVVGSIASLTGLITQLKSFNNFCHNLRDIPEEIQRINKEISMLRLTLDDSDLRSQQLESRGFEVEGFFRASQEIDTVLTKVEHTLDLCTEELSSRKRATLVKRIRVLLKRKGIEQPITMLERMKTTFIAEKLNLDGYKIPALLLEIANQTNLQSCQSKGTR